MITLCCILALMLVSCDSSPISGLILSESPLEAESDYAKATQPAELSIEKPVYASVYFIESPKGMTYTVKWFINDEEVKSEEKAMVTSQKGVIIYSLESEKLAPGTLKLQILYKDQILSEKSVTLK